LNTRTETLLSTRILVFAVPILAAIGVWLAIQFGWEIVAGAFTLFFFVIVAFIDARFLIISIMLVFTLNQTTLVGGTQFMQIARWFVLGVGALYAIVHIFLRMASRKSGFVDIAAFIFLFYCFISIIYSSDSSLSFQRSVSLFFLYMTIFWTVWDYTNFKGIDSVIKTILISAILVYILGGGFAFFPGAWQSDGRFRGIMPNPNAFGLITAIYAPLLIWAWVKYKSWISLIVFVIAIIGLVFSGSRNGLLSVSIALIYLFFHIKLHRLLFVGLIFMSVIIAIFAFAGIDTLSINVPVIDRLINNNGNLDYTSGRLDAWISVLDQIQARPLYGYGFGIDALGFSEVSTVETTGVHNSYLSITYQLGLTGLLLFIIPILALLFISIRNTRNSGRLLLDHILQAVVLSGLVAALFETWPLSPGNAFTFPFWTCVMLLVRQLTIQKHNI